MTTWLIEDARVVADPLAGCYDPNQSVVVEGECILELESLPFCEINFRKLIALMHVEHFCCRD